MFLVIVWAKKNILRLFLIIQEDILKSLLNLLQASVSLFFQTNAVIVTFLVTILVPQHHTILCIFVQQLHLSSSRDKLDQSGDPSGIGLLSSFVGKGPLFLIGF